MEHYRFTGKNPTEEAFQKYPNWEYANDEEGVDGQDETTLKPQENQSFIEVETTITSADILFASGEKVSGGIGHVGQWDNEEDINHVIFFKEGATYEIMNRDGVWAPFFRTNESPIFALSDRTIFPLQAITKFFLEDGTKVEVVVN